MITCFDINDRECKIVTLSENKGSIFIHNVLNVTFPQIDSQDAKRIKIKSDLIKDAIKHNNIKIKKAVLIVPKQSVTVRLVSLPSSEDNEIAQMARFEAERHIPFNVERHIISHHTMKKEGVSGSKVLISAVDSPIIEDCIEILTNIGIDVESADISSLALYNIFLASNPNLTEDITTALIHIANYTTDITLIRKDLVIYTRSALHGLAKFAKDLSDAVKTEQSYSENFLDTFDLFFPEKSFSQINEYNPEQDPGKLQIINTSTENDIQKDSSDNLSEKKPYEIKNYDPFHKSESNSTLNEDSIDNNTGKNYLNHPARKVLNEWINRLFQEIRRTYEFARREFDCPPINRVFLSGEIARCINVKEFFSKNLSVEVNLNSGIQQIKPFPKAKGFDKVNCFYPYTETIGGACREIIKGSVKINLLPLSYINKKTFEMQKRNFMWIGLFALLALILTVIFFKERADYNNNMLKWYKTINEKNETEVAKLEDMDKKLKIIIKEVDSKRSALAILDKISALPYIPQRIALTDFVFISGDSVSISGHALEIEDLNKFLGDLENSGFFSIVRLKQRAPYELPYRPRKVQSFEINCFFEKKTSSRGSK